MILTPGVYMVVVFVVVLSAASWLFIGALMDEFHIMIRLVMVIIGVLAIVVMPNRDMYLPFLGETALPASILVDTPRRGNVIFAIDGVTPNAKVIYWAANPSKEVGTNPKSAYSNTINGGITTASEEGVAHITLDCPQSYKVNRLGIDKQLPKHVHFRVELVKQPGLFSPVQTRVLDVDTCPM